MGVLRTFRFVTGHPLVRDRPMAGIGRVLWWQMRSWLREEVVVDWIGDARLAVRRGMTGATGNVYCGLHETADMAFALHLLQEGDLFADVGANVGSYTVLAGKLCGAEVAAVEPDPRTMTRLRRNIDLNGLGDRARAHECAVGPERGRVRFTEDRDTMNQVLDGAPGEAAGREVEMRPLDDILDGRSPVLIKVDVEGFEEGVLRGATRTLADPTLLAMEIEGDTPQVRALLADAGFVEMAYDPFQRILSPPAGAREGANGLYVRDVDACRERVASAPYRRILGHRI